MRPDHQGLKVPIAVAGLIFLSAGQTFAESVYHWTDRNGISCYSNTTIPDGVTEYSVMSAARPETLYAEKRDSAGDTGEGMNETQAEDGSSVDSDSRRIMLRDRLERRRASIRFIENLLKTHPNDLDLRRGLYQKKQYLHEDTVRLKLLTE